MNISKDLLLEDHSKIKKNIEENYDYIIQKYIDIDKKYKPYNSTISDIIWVCWWQGLENAPEIVKICFERLKKTAGNRKIVLITEKNYSQYIEMPDYIIKKLKAGIISITHFSDALRVNLLSKYGGVWIDATCFFTADIFKDMTPEFYTVKLPYDEKEICVSEGKWCIFFMGSSKNNILFNFLTEFYNEYWKKEDKIMAYFLTDYAISVAYEKMSNVKKMIDNVPVNNPLIHELKEQLNNEFNQEELDKLLAQNKIHKLAHERKYINELENRKITFYGQLNRGVF